MWAGEGESKATFKNPTWGSQMECGQASNPPPAPLGPGMDLRASLQLCVVFDPFSINCSPNSIPAARIHQENPPFFLGGTGGSWTNPDCTPSNPTHLEQVYGACARLAGVMLVYPVSRRNIFCSMCLRAQTSESKFVDGDEAADATLNVTHVSTTPNGCPVSAELRLEMGFTLDKPLPRAVWDIKVCVCACACV